MNNTVNIIGRIDPEKKGEIGTKEFTEQIKEQMDKYAGINVDDKQPHEICKLRFVLADNITRKTNCKESMNLYSTNVKQTMEKVNGLTPENIGDELPKMLKDLDKNMKLQGQYFIVAHLPYNESKNIKARGRMMWIKFLDTEDKPELFTIYNDVQSQNHKITLGQSEKYRLINGKYISENAATKIQAMTRGKKGRWDAKTVRTKKKASEQRQAVGQEIIGRHKAKELKRVKEEEEQTRADNEKRIKEDDETQRKIKKGIMQSKIDRQEEYNKQQQQKVAAEEKERQRKAAAEREAAPKAAPKAAAEREAAEERKAAEEKERQRKAAEEKERQRKAAEEKAAAADKERKAAENERKIAAEKAAAEKAAAERKAAAEKVRKAAEEKERQRKAAAAERERQRKAAAAERERVAAEERKAAEDEERQRKAAEDEERQRKAAEDEERQRKAAEEKAAATKIQAFTRGNIGRQTAEGRALKQEEVNEKERIREELIIKSKDELINLSKTNPDSTFLESMTHKLYPKKHTEQKQKLIKDINTQIEIYNSNSTGTTDILPLNVESLSEKSIETIKKALNGVIRQMEARGGKSTRRRRHKMNPTRKRGHKKPKTKKKSNKGVINKRKTRSKK